MTATKRRVLFKEPKGGWQNPGRVMLNWSGDPIHDLERIADAYRAVAHDRVDCLRKLPNLRGGDEFEAYPVVFLYRHTLELSFKAILHAGTVALVDMGEAAVSDHLLRREHRLTPLFKECNRVFKTAFHAKPDDVWNFGAAGLRTYAQVVSTIEEFDEFDPGSYTFRYSMTTTGDPSLARGTEFDLYSFAKKVDTVLSRIAGMPEWIRDRMQDRWKAAYEAQQEAWANVDPSDYYEH